MAGESVIKPITYGIKITVMLLLAPTRLSWASMPWDGWSWSAPQAPIEYFFRRHQDMPLKSPNYQCQCPPSKECVVDYKINEDAPEFLKIRGLMKEEQLKELNEKILESQKAKTEELRVKRGNFKSRRQNEEVDRGCCCPPRSMMMPTFITDRKFDEISERLQNKVLS